MLRTLFVALFWLLAVVANGGVIYDIHQIPSVQNGDDVNGWIEFDFEEPSETFSMTVYPQQVVAFYVNLNSGEIEYNNPPLVETPLGIRNGVSSNIRPGEFGGMTATETTLTLDEGWFGLLEFERTSLGYETTGQSIQWQTQTTPGGNYWYEWQDGHPVIKRWQGLLSGPATVGTRAVQVSEPKQIVTILMACVGLVMSRKWIF